MRSDLDATRRLGELKSEFVESPPIRISSQSLFSMLSQAVKLISMKAASHGDMTLRLTFLPHHCNV